MPSSDSFPYRDAALPVEQRIADLVSRMTLDEKLAQLGFEQDKQASFLRDFAGPIRGVGSIGRCNIFCFSA